MLHKLTTIASAAAVAAALMGSAAWAEKLTILTWNLPGHTEKVNGWIEDFHAIYPDIEVEWIDKKGSDWATFYQVQLAGGTPPDIINVQGALWAEYAENGNLLDLTPYLEADPNFSGRFVDGALDLWAKDGKNWMVPWFFTRTILATNKAMLEDAGVEAPTSFDELIAAAEAMKGDGKSGFITLNFDWLFWPLFGMNGVHVLNEDMSAAAFNTPEGLATLTALANATKSGAINNISWTGRWVEPNTAFATGDIGMMLGTYNAIAWAAGKSEWMNVDSVGIMEMPGGAFTPNHQGWGVSKSTNDPDAAVAMVKIITSDKWQEDFIKTYSVLTLNKVADPAGIAALKESNPLKAALVGTASSVDSSLAVGYLKTGLDARIKDAFWTAVQPALLGDTDPQDALDEAERAINRILSR
jgi:ABC-type glycerol-3-phosphate transport system substrate-binding protein